MVHAGFVSTGGAIDNSALTPAGSPPLKTSLAPSLGNKALMS